MERVTDFIGGGPPKSLQIMTAAMKLKDASWKENYDKPRQHIKKQRHYFANKGLSRQGHGFSSSPVWMWELDNKKGWALKNWRLQAVVLEKTLESPLDCKEIQPVHPKGNQPWIFIGRTDAEVEAPILWTPDAKSQLTGKDPDAWKDWKQEEKGTTEDEMVGWHHWLNGHESQQTPGDGEEQESLACCSPLGSQRSYMTEQLNNNKKNFCKSSSLLWCFVMAVLQTRASFYCLFCFCFVVVVVCFCFFALFSNRNKKFKEV